MNQIKEFAHYISKYPGIKRFLKFNYQLLAFLINFHSNKYLGKFKLQKISNRNGGFFGYYDKSPESPDGKFVVFHEIINDKSSVNVVLYEVATQKCSVVATSKAFNFQIGTRLQWINKNQFVFNIYDELTDKYGALVYSIDESSFKRINSAIFDAHGTQFISVNFENLYEVGSEYAYSCRNSSDDTKSPAILLGNLNTDEVNTIFNLDSALTLVPIAQNGIKYHFNHLMFSPDGNNFIFIFRWTTSKGRREALLNYNLTANLFSVLNIEMTSHCCWVDNETIFGYMKFGGNEGYYSLNINDGKHSLKHLNQNLGDGHPSVKNNLILIDSYPDNSRMQHLMLISKENPLLIGSFFAPLTYNESNRCDLHPRFNYIGNSIYIDSKHEGVRNLYKIKLNTGG